MYENPGYAYSRTLIAYLKVSLISATTLLFGPLVVITEPIFILAQLVVFQNMV